MSENNRPLRSLKIGSVEVSVWGGEYGCNITIQKSYKDKMSQQWKRTGNLGMADAVVAHRLLGEAIEVAQKIDAQQSEDRPPRRDDRYERPRNGDYRGRDDRPRDDRPSGNYQREAPRQSRREETEDERFERHFQEHAADDAKHPNGNDAVEFG